MLLQVRSLQPTPQYKVGFDCLFRCRDAYCLFDIFLPEFGQVGELGLRLGLGVGHFCHVVLGVERQLHKVLSWEHGEFVFSVLHSD